MAGGGGAGRGEANIKRNEKPTLSGKMNFLHLDQMILACRFEIYWTIIIRHSY